MSRCKKNAIPIYFTKEVRERGLTYLSKMGVNFNGKKKSSNDNSISLGKFAAENTEKYGGAVANINNINKYFGKSFDEKNYSSTSGLSGNVIVFLARALNISFKYLFFGIGDETSEVEDFDAIEGISTAEEYKKLSFDVSKYCTDEELNIVNEVNEKVYNEIVANKTPRKRSKNAKSVSSNVDTENIPSNNITTSNNTTSNNIISENIVSEDILEDIIDEEIVEANPISEVDAQLAQLQEVEEELIKKRNETNKKIFVKSMNELAEAVNSQQLSENKPQLNIESNNQMYLQSSKEEDKKNAFVDKEKTMSNILLEMIVEKWKTLTVEGRVYVMDFINQIEDPKFKIN
jgi:hypothetical protein